MTYIVSKVLPLRLTETQYSTVNFDAVEMMVFLLYALVENPEFPPQTQVVVSSMNK
jgi:hypothetical protein